MAKKKAQARKKTVSKKAASKKTSAKAATISRLGGPAGEVEERERSSLTPYANNARTHSDEQVKRIVASMQEFGWTIPVLIDEEGNVIAGHGRLLAAEVLGIELVPCIVARGWSEAQRRAYTLADNKLTLSSGWDMEMLTFELSELKKLDFELDLTGFSKAESDGLFSVFGDSDAAGTPDEEWLGMPNFKNEDQTSHRHIVVHFRNDDDVREFEKRIRQEVTDKARFLWFPPKPRTVFADKRYGNKKDDKAKDEASVS